MYVISRIFYLWLMLKITIFTSQVVNLIRDLDTDFSILGKNYVNIIQVSAHLLAMSSTCYNPFIYASLHDKFLSYLCLHFLSRRKGKGKDRSQGSSIPTASHRMQRLHTSTIVADLPGAGVSDSVLQENPWVVFQLIRHNNFTSHLNQIWCSLHLLFSRFDTSLVCNLCWQVTGEKRELMQSVIKKKTKF